MASYARDSGLQYMQQTIKINRRPAMKKHRLTAGLIAAVFLLAGCTADTTSAPAEKSSDDNVVETQTDSTDKAVTDMSSTTITNATLPEELAAIPQDYLSESDQPGTLVELEYDTYESMTYDQKDTVLHKRAIVYLPYGYSEDTEYNVFYRTAAGAMRRPIWALRIIPMRSKMYWTTRWLTVRYSP